MKRLRIDWIDYQSEGSTIESFISASKSELLGWEIYFNKPIPEAEAWFVIEGSSMKSEEMSVPDGMLFFGTGDTIWGPDFYNGKRWRLAFLEQFDQVHSCHEIDLPNVVNEIPFHHWMINANTGTNVIANHTRNYDYLVNLEVPIKTKDISVICSTKTFTPHHARRLEFVEGLKNHFGERLDWFGNGKMPVQEKWDALIDYKFSIAIENQSKYNVVTEKILDPYLTYTFPIYSGAPNISEYFDENSFLSIDIFDLQGSIDKIEKLLNSPISANTFDQMEKARAKVLNDYNFVQRIVNIAEYNFGRIKTVKYRKNHVVPMSKFQPLTSKVRDRLTSRLYWVYKLFQ